MKFISYLSSVLVIGFLSCSQTDNVMPIKPGKEQLAISEFSISLDGKEYKGTIQDSTISLTVPYESDISVIRPKINLLSGVTISPTTSQAVDFSKPVKYVVRDVQGKLTSFIVIVKNLPSPLAITNLSVDSQIGTTQIDTAKHKITINVSSSADLSKIFIREIASSPGTTVTPGMLQSVNFLTSSDTSAKFLVKGMHSEVKEWKISIKKEKPILSSEKDIIEFEAATDDGMLINAKASSDTITLTYYPSSGPIAKKPGGDPGTTSGIKVIVKKITLSPFAIVLWQTPTTIDFPPGISTYPLYIRAQDGSIKNWTVKLTTVISTGGTGPQKK